MPTVNKPKYRQPQNTYWVRVKYNIHLHGKIVIPAGTICKMEQYLEADARYAKGMATIRVKGSTGHLVGLTNNEFSYCTQQGGELNAPTDIAV